MLFPQFASYMQSVRKTPGDQQQQNPGLYQQMPTQLPYQADGEKRQEEFNEQQKQAKTNACFCFCEACCSDSLKGDRLVLVHCTSNERPLGPVSLYK